MKSRTTATVTVNLALAAARLIHAANADSVINAARQSTIAFSKSLRDDTVQQRAAIRLPRGRFTDRADQSRKKP
jgi:hypothetical protein